MKYQFTIVNVKSNYHSFLTSQIKMGVFKQNIQIDTRDTTYGRQPPGFQGMFECYTSILQRLASLDFGPQMPLLESLKLAFNPRSVCFGYTHRFTRQMFVNFLAIAKLILKFKRTLKEVEIDFTGASDTKRNPEELQRLFGIDLMLSQEQLTEMQECTDAFNELVNLNRIRCRAINIRDNPWDWGKMNDCYKFYYEHDHCIICDVQYLCSMFCNLQCCHWDFQSFNYCSVQEI